MRIPEDLAERIKAGEIGVIPTDTLYGLVASALDPAAVERVYEVRQRDLDKPSIILIAEPRELGRFGVPEYKTARARHHWPGPVSVVLPVEGPNWDYLHRGQRSLAFREPKPQWLRDFLAKSGPLIAPSANPEGKPPARTINEAKAYFADTVDFYVDGGELAGKPSQLISMLGMKPEGLR